MKLLSTIYLIFAVTSFVGAQNKSISNQEHSIVALVDQYSQAREKSDTVLLKSILTADVDQLVSNGEWRKGIRESVKGMLRSSASNTGSRTLKVDKVRFFNSDCAIADARYEITNADGTIRKMWSTFVVVRNGGVWRISAIRNMLPAGS